MFKRPKKVEIALPEKIGNPKLFVGRKEELDVIPFYFSIRDSDQTLGMFATDFFAEKDLYTTMAGYIKEDNWHFMWKIASEAPATIGRLKGVKNRPNHR
jgi:hypothetical protein